MSKQASAAAVVVVVVDVVDDDVAGGTMTADEGEKICAVGAIGAVVVATADSMSCDAPSIFTMIIYSVRLFLLDSILVFACALGLEESAVLLRNGNKRDLDNGNRHTAARRQCMCRVRK